MAPKIYNSKDPLDLNRLRLSKPVNRNGSHFIKMFDIDNPIYVLGPKCYVKNGFVKSGKKIFCDFVFTNDDSDLLSWLENLEEKSRNLIYENRDTWFETPLDEHDIESSMSPPYKTYKSGKCFIIRANVSTALDKINIKIYDENENETDAENIRENTNVLAVLEFQGIRCSVRSFQFEIELKQLLIVEPEKIFEKCIIRSVRKPSNRIEESPVVQEKIVEETKEDAKDETKEDNLEANLEAKVQEQEQLPDESVFLEKDTLIEEVTDLPFEVMDEDLQLKSITDADTEKEPPLRLKSRNDVYYKLYKEMRQRAKEAKREALANYLEAKRIKNTYLLEDVSESEDDLDDLEV